MKTIGWYCSYVPEEIVIAGGYNSERLLNLASSNIGAEVYFPVGFCPYIKALFMSLLNNKRKYVGIIFPDSCDQSRRLGDLANIYLKDKPDIFRIDYPRKRTKTALDFFREELKRFKNDFERTLNVDITNEQLAEAIRQSNSVRKKVLEIRDLYYNFQIEMNIDELLTIFSKMTFSDAERKVKELQRIIDKKKLPKKEQFNGPKIGLIASCIPQSIREVIEFIEEYGARIIFDDICIGSRHFEGLVDESLAPMEAIARRYLTTANCPHTAISRASFIQEKTKNKNIDGFVFFGLKFCDGAAWDYVANKPPLDRQGIPNIRIEAELGGVDHELLRTRLGAFIEILESKEQ